MSASYPLVVRCDLPVNVGTVDATKAVHVHELALCEAIARTVLDRVEHRRVTRVALRIGHFRQVVPDALTFSWELLTTDTDLEGSELEVEHVPATVECSECGAFTTLQLPVLVCGTCGSHTVTLRTGNEFLIVSCDVAEEVRDGPVPPPQ
jgi:hydrogenase nickel incorporation protein HypA/HybF